MRVAWAAIKLGVLHRFAYRVEIVTSILSASVVVVLNASIWRAVMRETPSIGGLSGVQLSTYVIVAWVVMATTSGRLEENLGNRYRSGQIASDLTKPLDLQLYLQARDLGRGLASLLVSAAPVVLFGALIFPFAWPQRWLTWPLVGLSLLLSLLLGGALSFLVGIASFGLKNITGLSRLKMTLVALLSGALVPLDALPEPVLAVVRWLPFQALAHTPASLFLERIPVLPALGLQLMWLLLLWGACRLAWARALRQLTVQGG